MRWGKICDVCCKCGRKAEFFVKGFHYDHSYCKKHLLEKLEREGIHNPLIRQVFLGPNKSGGKK